MRERQLRPPVKMKYNMWTPDDQQKTGAHFNTNRERITSTSASQGRKLSRVWFAPFVLCCILSILSIRSSSSLLAEYAHKESLSNIVVSGRSSSVNNDPRASEKCTGMSDKVLAQTTTHIVGRSIPKVVRFILQSKCIPEEVAETHNQNWKQAKNHTIIYYDQEYVDEYMSQEHKDFPAAASKYKCITDNVARMDLVKLMLLWDKGGIAVDFGNIPGPAFKNGDIISDADECIFEVDAEWATNPRFLACRPRHAALYVAITKLLAVALIDFPGFTISIEGRRSYFGYISEFMTGADHGNIKTIRVQQNGQQFDGHKIVQINTNRTNGELLTSLVVSKETMRDLKLRELSKLEQDQCKVKMINNSFEVDIDSLLELVGVGAKENTTCPEDLTYIGSRYNDGSILKGRKIPKIVHKTAKSKCFADLYVPAMHTWMFEDHSFFVHDDEAVNKLLNREWPEFPLLQQARSCIATGAGMAGAYVYSECRLVAHLIYELTTGDSSFLTRIRSRVRFELRNYILDV